MRRWAVAAIAAITSCGSAAPIAPGLPSAAARAAAIRALDRELEARGLPSPFAFARILWTEGGQVAFDDTEAAPGKSEIRYSNDMPRCLLVIAAGGRAVHETAFVHEALHCVAALRDGDGDHEHARSIWSLEPVLNARLAGVTP